MTDSFNSRGNIFGNINSTTSVVPAETASSETTAAGKLIDHLKYTADAATIRATDASGWLQLAANAGQNGIPGGFVQRQYTEPDKLTRAGTFAAWDLPALSAPALELPTVPDDLKVDLDKLRAETGTDLANLQSSWIARFVPDVTSLAPLTSILDNVLGGSVQASAQARLDLLAATTAADLKAAVALALQNLTNAIGPAKTNLTTNFADADAAITGAIDTAKDCTSDVAFGRARDQAVREATRQSKEAISAWAGRGFSLPGGTLLAMQARGRQAVQDAANDSAARLAEKAQQFFIDLARVEADAWLRKMTAQSEEEIQFARAQIDAYLKQAELTLDADKFIAQQALQHLQLSLDFTRFTADLAMRYRLGVIEAVANLVRVYAGLRGAEMEYLKAIALARREMQSAVLDYYRAALSQAEIGLRLDQVNQDTTLRYIGTAANFIGTAVGHHVQAASSEADVFARIAAMALSGLNGIASVAASS